MDQPVHFWKGGEFNHRSTAPGYRTPIAIRISFRYGPPGMWRAGQQHEKENQLPLAAPFRLLFFFTPRPRFQLDFLDYKVRHAANLAPTHLIENNQSRPGYPETHFHACDPSKIGQIPASSLTNRGSAPKTRPNSQGPAPAGRNTVAQRDRCALTTRLASIRDVAHRKRWEHTGAKRLPLAVPFPRAFAFPASFTSSAPSASFGAPVSIPRKKDHAPSCAVRLSRATATVFSPLSSATGETFRLLDTLGRVKFRANA